MSGMRLHVGGQEPRDFRDLSFLADESCSETMAAATASWLCW